LAAKPGSSNHNFGIALDINSVQANALSSSGLLSKYGFHRPLAPREKWHIESKYYSRKGKSTTAAVTQTVKDSANTAKVQQAAKETVKNNPIAKEEAKVRPVAERKKVAAPDASDTLKNLTNGGFNPTQRANATNQTDVFTSPDGTPLIQRAPDLMDRVTDSASTAKANLATQQNTAVQQSSNAQEVKAIHERQLGVQVEMLRTLKEISGKIGLPKQQENDTTKSTEQTKPVNMDALVRQIKSTPRDIPVSMGVTKI
jgi:hypothetical protein